MLILALRFLSSRGLVIFLYWWVLDMGTSVGLVSLGELENPDSDNFCSGEDSVEEAPESGPIMVVEVTRGLKAENGDCQFMAGSVFLSSHLTLVVTQGIGQELANGSSELVCSDQSEVTVCLYLTLFLAAQVRTMETMTVRKCQTIRHRHDPT